MHYLENRYNALNRVLICFSHLEKKATRIDSQHYEIDLFYDENDEKEMIIRILSFGSVIKIEESKTKDGKRIVDNLRQRLERQLDLLSL